MIGGVITNKSKLLTSNEAQHLILSREQKFITSPILFATMFQPVFSHLPLLIIYIAGSKLLEVSCLQKTNDTRNPVARHIQVHTDVQNAAETLKEGESGEYSESDPGLLSVRDAPRDEESSDVDNSAPIQDTAIVLSVADSRVVSKPYNPFFPNSETKVELSRDQGLSTRMKAAAPQNGHRSVNGSAKVLNSPEHPNIRRSHQRRTKLEKKESRYSSGSTSPVKSRRSWSISRILSKSGRDKKPVPLPNSCQKLLGKPPAKKRPFSCPCDQAPRKRGALRKIFGSLKIPTRNRGVPESSVTNAKLMKSHPTPSQHVALRPDDMDLSPKSYIHRSDSRDRKRPSYPKKHDSFDHDPFRYFDDRMGHPGRNKLRRDSYPPADPRRDRFERNDSRDDYMGYPGPHERYRRSHRRDDPRERYHRSDSNRDRPSPEDRRRKPWELDDNRRKKLEEGVTNFVKRRGKRKRRKHGGEKEEEGEEEEEEGSSSSSSSSDMENTDPSAAPADPPAAPADFLVVPAELPAAPADTPAPQVHSGWLQWLCCCGGDSEQQQQQPVSECFPWSNWCGGCVDVDSITKCFTDCCNADCLDKCCKEIGDECFKPSGNGGEGGGDWGGGDWGGGGD